jgi:hypothetical protein
MPSDLRVVFDTNTLISAFLLPNSIPRQALDSVMAAGRLLLSPATAIELTLIRNYQTAKAPRTPWVKAQWKETSGTPKDPKSAFSDSLSPEPEFHILSGLGVMAVQFFCRIGANRGPASTKV